MIRLTREAEKLDKGGLEQIKRAHSVDFNELLDEFFINIYQWLNKAEQQKCLEDCQKVSQYADAKYNRVHRGIFGA